MHLLSYSAKYLKSLVMPLAAGLASSGGGSINFQPWSKTSFLPSLGQVVGLMWY